MAGNTIKTRLKSRQNWIFCAVMLVLCLLLCLIPDRYGNITSTFPRTKVRIDAVDNSLLDAVGIVYNGAQVCDVTVLGGDYAGQNARAYNYMNSALDKDKIFEAGDTAWAMLQGNGDALVVTLVDHYRADTLAWMVCLLAAALILFGGATGCGSMVSLVASAIVVWKLLIPLLLEGMDPILASFATVLILTIVIELLVAGFTRRCVVAILGAATGTVVTCVCAVLFTHLLKLDGGDLPYLVPLLSQSAMQIDSRSLYIGMMFLVSSGALMDLAMDVAVALDEIHRVKPDVSSKELLKSGLFVGRSSLSTMTTTLMLAYSGSYLSMMMYFVGQGTHILDLLNLKYVASQLLSTLIGSFGLVAAAPLTAMIASWIYVRGSRREN